MHVCSTAQKKAWDVNYLCDSFRYWLSGLVYSDNIFYDVQIRYRRACRANDG